MFAELSNLVQDMAQPVEDGGEAARRHLAQFLAALLQEADGHLHRVVGGVLQQQRQNLQRQQFVRLPSPAPAIRQPIENRKEKQRGNVRLAG